MRLFRHSHIVICAACGLILSLAFPKANASVIAWLAIAPLIYYTFALSWRRALLSGFAFGIAFFAGLLYWIGLFGYLPIVLLAIIQSLYVVGFVAVARLTGLRLGSWGRLILAPCVWVLFEWLSSLWITGFPWGNLGYSQYKALPVVQLASVTGVWGVSFVLAFSNAVLANLIAAREHKSERRAARMQVVIAAAVAAAVWGFGAVSIARFSPSGTPLRAAIVQGNINQNVPHGASYIDRVWRVYSVSTRMAAQSGAGIIVWPEGVVPGCISRDPFLLEKLSGLSKDSNNALLLVGGRDEDDAGRVYNCAYLIGPNGILGKYAKVHLVPFGEFVILRDYLPLLGRYRVTPYDYSPGTQLRPLNGGGKRIGAVICFESAFPQISRRLTDSGAGILCVITNDAWFGRTSAAEQHMATSVFRAVENRRCVLHAAATGASSIVDPCGRISARAGLFKEEVLVGDVRLIHRKTFYTRHGEWFVYACVTMIALLGATSLRAAAEDRRRCSSR